MTASTFQLTDEIQATRERIAYIGRLMFDRNLTDAGGGNISARVGDYVCISQTLCGANHQWQITADQVLVLDRQGTILVGDGKTSRETKVHLSLHNTYGEYGTGVIHGHPRHVMVFATAAQEMPPIMEATRKFGVTPVIDYAPAHSAKLAKYVTESMKGREQRIAKHGAGTIAPWHGIFLMGRTLDAAFDAVERLDTNAFCILQSRNLGITDGLAAASQRMEDAIANFTED